MHGFISYPDKGLVNERNPFGTCPPEDECGMFGDLMSLKLSLTKSKGNVYRGVVIELL